MSEPNTEPHPRPQPTPGQQMGSLLDDLDTAAPLPKKSRGLGGNPFKAFIASQTSTPERAKRFRGITGSIAGLGIGGLAVWGVLLLIPVAQPDYLDDPMDDVLGYTLLTTEFNRLPLEDRVDLIGQLVKRVEAMDADDGSVMAAFAAGIMGEAREQLEENASQLVIDMWDEFAPGYQNISDPADREAYLADAVVGMTRLVERLDGDPTSKSDDELLADARRQAERDQEIFSDPARGPSAAGVARFMSLMEREVGSRATPHQRARIAQISRDMTRYLRGEPIDGGG